MSEARRIRLALVVCADDAQAASELLFTISDRAEFVEDGPADGVLVVVSQAAVDDTEWNAAVRRHADDQLVPLQLGPVKGAPDAVAHLNWIPFDPDDLARTADVVVLAAQTDAARHRVRRALEADAHIWALSGRAPSTLILDLGRIRAVDAAVATGDPLARPDHTADAFLAASRVAARRTRRRRIWQVAWRVAAVTIAVSLFVAAAIQFRAVAARQTMSIGAGDIAASVTPSIRAVKAAAVLIDLNENSAPGRAGAVMAVEALSEEWAVAEILPTWDMSINGSVLTSAGLVTVDGGGTVTWWGEDDVPDRRLAVGDGPLFALTATPDGGVLVVSGADAVLTTDGDGVVTASRDAPFPPTALAVSNDGRVVAAAAGDQVAAATGADTFATTPLEEGALLRLVPAATTVLALVLGEDELTLVDAVTGETVRSWFHGLPTATAALSSGDFDVDLGVGYLAGPGGQLWRFSEGTAVEPTGLTSPVAPTAVDVSPQGWALVSSAEEGVVLHFPDEGITYGQVCTSIDVPAGASIAPNGDRVAFATAMALAVYELDRLGPVADPGAFPREDNALTTPDPEIVQIAAFAPDGDTADVTLGDGREFSLNVPVTAFAQSRAGTVAFASGDEVQLLDPTRNGLVFATIGAAPGGATVTALEWLDAGEVLATTADGLSWRLRGCAACLGGDEVVDVVAERLSQCFAADQLAAYDGAVRSRMGLRECSAPPQAEAP